MPVLEIPWQQLSAAALKNLIEEFITRNGTDYGDHEVSLEDKLAQLQGQIQSGDVLVIFDEESESCQLVTRQQRPKYG